MVKVIINFNNGSGVIASLPDYSYLSVQTWCQKNGYDYTKIDFYYLVKGE